MGLAAYPQKSLSPARTGVDGAGVWTPERPHGLSPWQRTRPLPETEGLGSQTDSLQRPSGLKSLSSKLKLLFSQWNFRSAGLENFVFSEVSLQSAVAKKSHEPLTASGWMPQ